MSDQDTAEKKTTEKSSTKKKSDNSKELFSLELGSLYKVEPVGLALGPEVPRPFILFKSPKLDKQFAVWIDPFLAGYLLKASLDPRSPSIFEFPYKIFDGGDVKFERAVFVDFERPGKQTLQLDYKVGKETKSVVHKAKVGVGFCLDLKLDFFATEAFLKTIPEAKENHLNLLAEVQKKGTWPNGQKYLI